MKRASLELKENSMFWKVGHMDYQLCLCRDMHCDETAMAWTVSLSTGYVLCSSEAVSIVDVNHDPIIPDLHLAIPEPVFSHSPLLE